MNKHTPGPWIITEGDEWTDSIHTDTEQSGIWSLAFVNTRRHEFKENRRLIAAAPDLLEALKEALEEFLFDCYDDHPSAKKWRAAIAKATGETE
jgi:hypothetical protein